MGILDFFIQKDTSNNTAKTSSSAPSSKDAQTKQQEDLQKIKNFEKKLEEVKIKQEAALPGEVGYISESVMSQVDQALSLKNPFRGK